MYNKKYLYEILKRLETNKDLDASKIEIDKKLYNKMKKLNPNSIIANRTVKDILSRFETKIYKDPRTSDGKRSVKIIKRFLKLRCPIEKAPKLLSDFFEKNKLNIKIARDYFPIIGLMTSIIFIWIPNMIKKDKSLSRYPEFSSYKKKSKTFFPFLF